MLYFIVFIFIRLFFLNVYFYSLILVNVYFISSDKNVLMILVVVNTNPAFKQIDNYLDIAVGQRSDNIQSDLD